VTCGSQGASTKADINESVNIGVDEGIPRADDSEIEAWFKKLEDKDGFELCLKAAKEGDFIAQFTIGILLVNHPEASQEFISQGIIWLQASAEQGCVHALVELGMIHRKGRLVEKDDSLAFHYFGEAARRNDPVAQVNYALMYRWGKGVEQNVQEAIKWMLKAEAQGQAEASYRLGLYYQDGEVVPVNLDQAIVHFKRAADKGQKIAAYNLAHYYYNGETIPKDLVAARKYYEISASAGYADAMYHLGKMMLEGEGGAKDVAGAIRWLELGAKNPWIILVMPMSMEMEYQKTLRRQCSGIKELWLRVHNMHNSAWVASTIMVKG
jgi:TPR repeat protein